MIKYIVCDKVMFIPDENKLCPLGTRGPEVILNAPMSRFLFLLLKKNGEVAFQNEIFQEVWIQHGQVVTRNTLYQNVSLLRKALKKTGISTPPIRTHPKSGFSFRGNIKVIELDAVSDPGLAGPMLLAVTADTISVDESASPLPLSQGKEALPGDVSSEHVVQVRKKIGSVL